MLRNSNHLLCLGCSSFVSSKLTFPGPGESSSIFLVSCSIQQLLTDHSARVSAFMLASWYTMTKIALIFINLAVNKSHFTTGLLTATFKP